MSVAVLSSSTSFNCDQPKQFRTCFLQYARLQRCHVRLKTGRGQHKRCMNSRVMVDAVPTQYELPLLLFRGGELHFQHQRVYPIPQTTQLQPLTFKRRCQNRTFVFCVGDDNVNSIRDEFALTGWCGNPSHLDPPSSLISRMWTPQHVVRYSRHGVPVDLQFFGRFPRLPSVAQCCLKWRFPPTGVGHGHVTRTWNCLEGRCKQVECIDCTNRFSFPAAVC